MQLPINRAAIARALSQRGINVTGLELREYEFYDYQPYAVAGQQKIGFFSRSTSSRTADDCNLDSVSQIPNTMIFVPCAFSVEFRPGAAPASYGAGATPAFVNDYRAVMNSGRLSFRAGSQRTTYLECGPLHRFPSPSQVMLGGAASDASTAAASQRTLIQQAVTSGPLFTITPKVLLPSDPFSLDAEWATVAPVSVAGVIGARMIGYLADR